MDMFNEKLNLSIVILTYNEETNLPRCLDSVKSLNCDIFVVDSGSKDKTLEIAQKYNTHVYIHNFENHTKQWIWALDNLPIKTEWILALDADQILTYELSQEIKEIFSKNSDFLEDINGFWIKRRQIFRGKWIKNGGYYPIYLLKLFRKDKVYLSELDMANHYFYVKGRTAKLKHDIIEENLKELDIIFWIKKHINYANLMAEEEFKAKNSLENNIVNSIYKNSPSYKKKAIERKIWYRLPLYLRSVAYFMYRYFFRLGFLDGKEGFIFHFLQAFWFRILVDIRLEDLLKEN
ncbi:MAG: glycosyltransferase family 2 protein [Bacteroidetes bacterium]|nr:glycosyltransferase family 2 protein [Bacteroidota bacterium]